MSKAGRRAETLTFLRAARNRWVNDRQLTCDIGLRLAEAGEPDEAVRLLEEALKKWPDDALVMIGLLDVFERLGKLDKVLFYANKLLEKGPNSSAAARVVRLMIKQKKNREAVEFLKADLKRHRLNRAFIVNHINALVKIEAADELLASLESVHFDRGHDEDWLCARKYELAKNSGRSDKLPIYLKEWMKVNGNVRNHIPETARIMAKAGKEREAARFLEDVKDKWIGVGYLEFGVAQVMVELGKVDEAVTIVDAIVK